MARRSPEERLATLNQKLAQLESRKHALETQTQEKERKARTRMLIQIGGIMVKLGMDSLDKAQAFQHQVQAHPDWWAILTQTAEGQEDPHAQEEALAPQTARGPLSPRDEDGPS